MLALDIVQTGGCRAVIMPCIYLKKIFPFVSPHILPAWRGDFLLVVGGLQILPSLIRLP
jgi:hypothetical protein